ncbi:Plectin [Labeo rohita]|uniref:Plectin n=1 Tax=Labeo rohita TaxID=84645 RepID=A0ABQ8LYQ0_LABRO|nr:Plectin [Labeo rohita]
MKSTISFVLGAVAGGTLGAMEVVVNQIMQEIISGAQLKPVISGIKSVGALGLGALLGTTALVTSMTAVVTGIIVAVSVALCLLTVRKSEGWPVAGLVAALATTSCGAALGAIIEKLSMSYGMVSLLWALGIFTVLKLLMHIVVKYAYTEQKLCGSITDATKREQARLLASEVDLRQRVALELEQRIMARETQKPEEDSLDAWEAQRREREEIKRQQKKVVELEMHQRTSQQNLLKVVAKYMEFLAFSGLPMTVTAFVSAGFGIFGFGGYRFVFVILLVVVLCMSFWLMRSWHLNFWMLTGCMGMFATFAIAMLTLHAGQEAAGMSVKMHLARQNISKESIIIRMAHTSSVQAISAGFFVSKVCQVGLGATVGGPVAREAGGKVVWGASVTAAVVLLIVKVPSLMLGVGGKAGALLGAAGAAGVSMGGAAAIAVKSSSWGGTIGTTAGMIFGFLVFGKWDIVNIGLPVCVAYLFAMTSLD